MRLFVTDFHIPPASAPGGSSDPLREGLRRTIPCFRELVTRGDARARTL